METYENRGGNSGVSEFEIGQDFVWVAFSDRWKYLYTVAGVGSQNIEEMKTRAQGGQCLNTFINQNEDVRNGYDRKELC
jgi:hypothetical protein